MERHKASNRIPVDMIHLVQEPQEKKPVYIISPTKGTKIIWR